MQLYHWFVLVLVIFAVVGVFARATSGLVRTVVSVIALVMFAGFVWGTMTPEAKDTVTNAYDSVKEDIGNFFQEVFNFGQSLPESQAEAVAEANKR